MIQSTAAYSSALEGSLPPSSFSKYLHTCEQTHTCVETKQINLKPHIQWRFMSEHKFGLLKVLGATFSNFAYLEKYVERVYLCAESRAPADALL